MFDDGVTREEMVGWAVCDLVGMMNEVHKSHASTRAEAIVVLGDVATRSLKSGDSWIS